MTSLDDKVPGFIRNEAFYAFARVCMIVSLPLGGYFGNRIISGNDEIRAQLARQDLALQLLTNDVKYRTGHLDDVEQRVRKLELARRPAL